MKNERLFRARSEELRTDVFLIHGPLQPLPLRSGLTPSPQFVRGHRPFAGTRGASARSPGGTVEGSILILFLPSLVIPAHAGGNRKVDQNRRRGRSSGISSLVDPKWPRKTKRKSHWIPACAGMTDARVERADTWVRPYRLSLILQSGLTLKGGMIVDACGLPSSYGVL